MVKSGKRDGTVCTVIHYHVLCEGVRGSNVRRHVYSIRRTVHIKDRVVDCTVGERGGVPSYNLTFVLFHYDNLSTGV